MAGRWFVLGHCFASFRPSAATASAAPSGRAVKDASLFDGGRGNNFTRIERAWTVVCPRSMLLLPRLFGREFAVLLEIALHFGFAP